MSSIGIDGCKAGWFAVILNDEEWDVSIFKNISQVTEVLELDQNMVIDIPIGLRHTEKEERTCDLEARKLLNRSRKSSIFPAPCRAAIFCETYQEANNINRKMVGRGLSKQTWNITSKIKEVDHFLHENPERRQTTFESHPEIAFAFFAENDGMVSRKKTISGLKERLDILSIFDSRTKEIYDASVNKYLRKELARDDIVDAICMAIIGEMILKTGLRTIPKHPERDKEGIEMRICLPNKASI